MEQDGYLDHFSSGIHSQKPDPTFGSVIIPAENSRPVDKIRNKKIYILTSKVGINFAYGLVILLLS